MKVLIVDDAPTVRSLVKTTLEGMGITVLGASNGKEALDMARREAFTLIISDINMP
ncbi:MAG: response regulator, partial [Deltaproteobacteria bacterium]